VVPCRCGLHDLAQVVGDAGDAQQAAFALEKLVDLGQLHAAALGQVEDDGRVDVAGAGAHDHPFERGQSHGGVDGTSIFDRGQGAAVAQVAGYARETLFSAQDLGGPSGYVPVRGAVEAVFADVLFRIELVRQCVEVGVFGHGLVEGGVEDGDVRHVREELFGRLDTVQVRWVVQRCQAEELLDRLFHFRGDQGRLEERLATVDDAVADGHHGAAAAALRIEEDIADAHEGFGVIGRLHQLGDRIGAPAEFEHRLRLADALDRAVGHFVFEADVKQSELD